MVIFVPTTPEGSEDVAAALKAGMGGVAQSLLGSGLLNVAGSWVGARLGPPAKLALSRHLAEQRNAFMKGHILVAADVLAYQRNGAPIRDWVRGELEALEPPVVAVGHSLGGIILVDTLFGPDRRDVGVRSLVTFGSQSAFLACIGALGPVEPDLPWTNIWTRYDFASFLAGSRWPTLVTDVEVPIEVGFPDAHGAYYETPGFFDALRADPVVAGILA